MAVYVDDVRHKFGRMVMCHMWADGLDELLAMADAIGIARKWLQQPPKASWIHFDVSLGMKTKAIALGAILTDKYGPSEHTARLDMASGDRDLAERGQERLRQINEIRAIRRNREVLANGLS